MKNKLVAMPGRFFYLTDNKNKIDYCVREVGKGIFSGYDVWKYNKKLDRLSFIEHCNEVDFIKEYLK